MPKALFEPCAVGDTRPIRVEITSADNARITAATYRIVRRSDAQTGAVWDAGGAATVTALPRGFEVATPAVNFPSSDTYTAQFQLTWDDGQLDNSVSAVVPVVALAN